MTIQSKQRIREVVREKTASISLDPKSTVTLFALDSTTRSVVDPHAVFFMPVSCARQKVTQKKIAKCTKRLKRRNR